jgi:type II secretory pathway pseudopilin PulG
MKIISQRKKIAIGLISCILATTVFSVGVLDSYAEEKINVKVNYVAKLNELAKAGRPEELNAAPYYKRAFKLSVKQPEQLKKINRKTWPTDLSTKQLKILQTWVQQNAQALKHLKKGTQKPHHWPKYHGNSMAGIVLPQFRQAKTLAVGLCSRAKLEAVKGDYKDAFSDLLACYRFGTHFTGTKTLIEQLVGIAIRALAVDAGFQILDNQKSAANVLEDLQEQLQMISSQQECIIDFTAEKLSVYDIIQRVFSDDGKGGGRIPRPSTGEKEDWPEALKQLLPHLSEEQIERLHELDRRETSDLANKLYQYFGEVAQSTPWQLHSQGKDVQKAVEEMTKENPLLHTFMAAAGRLVELSCRSGIETQALISTIAILRYKAHKGQYPQNLEKLIEAGYLKKLPMDPYSGKPLVYTRTKVNFLLYSKDNFLLYSFGADFDDDGGVPSKWGEGKKGGDQVFWPVQPIQKPKDKKKQR